MKPTENHEPGDATAIEAEAMAWLAEREEGFAPGRAAAFDSWRRRDRRHAACVVELEHVLAQLDGLAERRDEVNAHFNRVSPLPPLGRNSPALTPAPEPTVRWWRPVVGSGLAAALVLGAFLGFNALRSTPGPATHYATTTAGYERARLADGSGATTGAELPLTGAGRAEARALLIAVPADTMARTATLRVQITSDDAPTRHCRVRVPSPGRGSVLPGRHGPYDLVRYPVLYYITCFLERNTLQRLLETTENCKQPQITTRCELHCEEPMLRRARSWNP